MRATALEFRFRMAIMVALVAVGFWAPWMEYVDVGRRMPLLEWLALELGRSGAMSFGAATALVIVAAALVAAAAAVLRVWGTAYLGSGTVNNLEMKAGRVVADGPYRYVRNPLYLGSWCMIAAMAFVMPPTGALFAVVLLTVFLLRLVLAEEAFLAAELGNAYQTYRTAVPRLAPRLRPALPPAGHRPHWGMGVLAEVNPIGVFLVIVVLSWSYEPWLLVRGILISFGISLVVRALLPAAGQEPSLES